MEDTKPLTKKVLVFSCKVCRLEFLVPKEFIEHRKEHLAAAELELKHQLQITGSASDILKSPHRIESEQCPRNSAQVSDEKPKEQGEKDQIPGTSGKDKEEECTVTTDAEIHFKLPSRTIQTRCTLVIPTNCDKDQALISGHPVGVTGTGNEEPTLSRNITLDPKSFKGFTPACLTRPVRIFLDPVDLDQQILKAELNSGQNEETTNDSLSTGRGEGELNPDRHRIGTNSATQLDIPPPIATSSTNEPKRPEDPADFLAEHPCSVCGKRIKGKLMPRHRRLHHLKAKPFQCFQCPYESFSSVSLWNHRKCHRTKSSNECPYCTASYDTARGLTLHLRAVHLAGLPKKTEQHPSPKVKQSKLKSKVGSQGQAVATTLQCGYCPKRFPTPNSRAYHELCHTRPYRCNQCPYTSGRTTDLRNHEMKRHGRNQSSVDIDEEMKARSLSSSPVKSLPVPTTNAGVREFNCRYCSMVFPTSRQLKPHENHHIRPFKCSRCHHGFRQWKDREEHKGRCTKLVDKRILNIQPDCSHCPMKFQKHVQLIQHTKLKHPGLKPFKCRECPYESFATFHLELHTFAHSVQNQFKCPHCTASFSLSHNRDKHVAIHNGKAGGGSASAPPKPKPQSEEASNCSEAKTMTIQIVPARKASIHPPGFYNLDGQLSAMGSAPEKTGHGTPMDMELGTGKQETGRRSKSPRGFEGNWGLQCPHCDYTSFHTAPMRTHVMRMHSGSGKSTFNCSDCSASYINKIGLETHRKNTHPESLQVQEDAQSPPTENLQQRMSTTKENEGSGVKCTSQSRLNEHELTHRRPFPCRYCPRAFLLRMKLQQHVQAHHQGRTKNVAPPQPRDTLPISDNTEQEPNRNLLHKRFSCTICKAVFSRLEDLETHAQLKCEKARETSNTQVEYGSQGIRLTTATSPATSIPSTTTGERSGGGQVTKIKITQENEEGLKITSIRFVKS